MDKHLRHAGWPGLQLLRSALLGIAACTATAAAQQNLLVNGGAEAGSLSGWADALGNGFGVSATTFHGGAMSFHPGTGGPIGPWDHELRQDVDVSALAAAIDAGAIGAHLSGYLRSNEASGYVDAGHVVLEFQSGGGVVLASYDSGAIAPWNAWHAFADERAVPAGTRTLRVRLLANRPVGGSTDCYFDDLELFVHEWQVEGAGCPGAAGQPALELVSPAWLGANYALRAANQTGGVSVMVTGLGALSLPLAPLGLGFGAGCSLLVTPDLLGAAQQVGGVANWSLAIPTNPLLVGFELRNQVLELSAPSSATPACRAVVR